MCHIRVKGKVPIAEQSAIRIGQFCFFAFGGEPLDEGYVRNLKDGSKTFTELTNANVIANIVYECKS